MYFMSWTSVVCDSANASSYLTTESPDYELVIVITADICLKSGKNIHVQMSVCVFPMV